MTPMTIPDAAVEAATSIIRAHDNEAWGEDCGDEPYADLVTRMLTAALPHLGWRVKELEWHKPAMADTLSRAETEFGTYRVWSHHEANGKWFWSLEYGCTRKCGESLDEQAAKSAAQADFTRRASSMLEASDIGNPITGNDTRAAALEEAAAMLDAKAQEANERAVYFTEKLSGPLKGRKQSARWNSEKTHNERLKFYYQKSATAIRALSGSAPVEPFQSRVKPWMLACFGEEISNDKLERSDRFIEEALELVQSIGYSPDRAHALVDYVFCRDIGEPHQEVGGVMVTLAALCLASNLDMEKAGEDELARIWTKVEKIRAKQAAKPTGSALPVALSGSGDGWLPIETAPKDGTEFIGWDGKWAFRCSAGKKYVLYPHMDGGPTYCDVWDGHYYDSLTIEHPTHWRPLPSAPADGGE